MSKQSMGFLNVPGKHLLTAVCILWTAVFFERNENMKKLRSYTNIWSVEKVIYAINDFRLPFPITFNQMSWFIITLLLVIVFGSLPPLNMINGTLLKYFGILVAVTFFMNKKTFDGKKPVNFLKSVCTYFLRPKITYAGKSVKYRKEIIDKAITSVRSEIYVPDKVH